MSSISNSTMQVMWNRVPLSKFSLVRGIHQGCPLSSYLFVLCMEWLGHLIQAAISEENWHPIRLSRDGPDISNLFFTDDVVIFSKTDSKHCKILKIIFDRFCALSGHKINARKTNIFFSKGVDEGSMETINTMLGIQRVHNLGHYLRVPLLHQRVTVTLFNLWWKKVCGKFQSWEAKNLSLAGRITLAQSVLLSIPSYFMQFMMIPRKTCDEIE